MEAIGGIKIFAMNDSDWYAGATEADALQAMAETLCFDDVEECRAEHCVDGPIVELDDEDLDTEMYVDEDEDGRRGDRRTFREQLQIMIDSGEEFPVFFASTEF
jgi:hypothetical protein